MKYPGYLLNPGDMFQVDPECVMFATGAPKEAAEQVAARVANADVEEEAGDEAAEEAMKEPEPAVEAEEDDDGELDRDPKTILKDLQSQAKSILAHDRQKIGAKRKQDLRAFTKAVKRMLSRSANSTILTESLEAQFIELKNQLRIQRQQDRRKTKDIAETSATEKAVTNASSDKPLAEAQLDAEQIEAPDPVTPDEAEYSYLSDADLTQLQQAFQTSTENPIDSSKPYATPWRPRDYMSAFTFIPRYLEVNQNICAGVYLRHPVVRPGLAEVPSPYGSEVNGAAYVWYLRRR